MKTVWVQISTQDRKRIALRGSAIEEEVYEDMDLRTLRSSDSERYCSADDDNDE